MRGCSGSTKLALCSDWCASASTDSEVRMRMIRIQSTKS
jgi:hypothetical protein